MKTPNLESKTCLKLDIFYQMKTTYTNVHNIEVYNKLQLLDIGKH